MALCFPNCHLCKYLSGLTLLNFSERSASELAFVATVYLSVKLFQKQTIQTITQTRSYTSNSRYYYYTATHSTVSFCDVTDIELKLQTPRVVRQR